MDRQAVARAIEELLHALGHEPEGGIVAAAEQVSRAWTEELLGGSGSDVAAILRDGAMALDERAAASGPTVVALRALGVTTMCPHHLLPAHGLGDVVYLPGARIAGLGAIARALDACTRRLVLQERAGDELARHLVEALGARGALVRLRLTHMCLVARGERRPGAVVETIALQGSFAEPGPDRELGLAALAGGAGG